MAGRRRVMNGKTFFIVNNEKEKKMEVLNAKEELIGSVLHGPKCEKKLDTLLETLSEDDEEHALF